MHMHLLALTDIGRSDIQHDRSVVAGVTKSAAATVGAGHVPVVLEVADHRREVECLMIISCEPITRGQVLTIEEMVFSVHKLIDWGSVDGKPSLHVV